MRIRRIKEHASFAAPWPSTALPAALLSTSTSIGLEGPALQLPRASGWPQRASGCRDPSGGGCGRATHGSLVNRTALLSTSAANCRVFGCGIGAGDHGNGLRHLGPSAAAIDRCHRPVEGAVGSAVRRVRERVRRCEASGQGAAGWRARGGRALQLAGQGNGATLTGSRRPKKRSESHPRVSDASLSARCTPHLQARRANAFESAPTCRVPYSTIGMHGAG